MPLTPEDLAAIGYAGIISATRLTPDVSAKRAWVQDEAGVLRVRAAPESSGGEETRRCCAACKLPLPPTSFSKPQLKKREGRRCKPCVQRDEQAKHQAGKRQQRAGEQPAEENAPPNQKKQRR